VQRVNRCLASLTKDYAADVSGLATDLVRFGELEYAHEIHSDAGQSQTLMGNCST
jgi:hypothetical protein